MATVIRAVEALQKLDKNSSSLIESFESQKRRRVWFSTGSGWSSRERTAHDRADLDAIMAKLGGAS